MSASNRCSIYCIVPPYVLHKLLQARDERLRESALRTLLTTASLRSERRLTAGVSFLTTSAGGAKRRTIYDCKTRANPDAARIVRGENDPPTADDTVNRAFDGLGDTYDFYKTIFQRNSVDGKGMRLNGYVHYSRDYNNAFWNGRQMMFGDGDGQTFTDFTKSLDVIAHELTHGVTEHSAGLEYHNQSGALNESISDVFGSLVKQWKRHQTAAEADWLIGVEITTPGIPMDALRSMKSPGTAFDNDILGRDPQPAHMDNFQQLPDTEDGDFGGVHINSGIPNHAFYLTAVAIGGNAWEAPGHIWYEALRASNADTDFQMFADLCYGAAGRLYGSRSAEQQAVIEAWGEVGIRVRDTSTASPLRAADRTAGTMIAGLMKDGESVSRFSRQIAELTKEVKGLRKEVDQLKPKSREAVTA